MAGNGAGRCTAPIELDGCAKIFGLTMLVLSVIVFAVLALTKTSWIWFLELGPLGLLLIIFLKERRRW